MAPFLGFWMLLQVDAALGQLQASRGRSLNIYAPRPQGQSQSLQELFKVRSLYTEGPWKFLCRGELRPHFSAMKAKRGSEEAFPSYSGGGFVRSCDSSCLGQAGIAGLCSTCQQQARLGRADIQTVGGRSAPLEVGKFLNGLGGMGCRLHRSPPGPPTGLLSSKV